MREVLPFQVTRKTTDDDGDSRVTWAAALQRTRRAWSSSRLLISLNLVFNPNLAAVSEGWIKLSRMAQSQACAVVKPRFAVSAGSYNPIPAVASALEKLSVSKLTPVSLPESSVTTLALT